MLSSGFYNSKGGDRKYDAEQFGAMFNGLITDGVFAHYKDALKVTAGSGNRELVVKPGRAWFNGTWTEVDDNDHSIYLMGSAVEATYFVYLAVNKFDRKNTIAWYSSIMSNIPEKGLYFYLLAQVTIPGGVNKITEAMITDTRGSDLCPYVTGIMETVSFEDLVKRVCGENWQDWLGVYEAGITTGVQNAIITSERALDEVKSLKAYAVESEAVSYIWAKFEAVPTGGGGFEWATDSVHMELSDPPIPMCLFRDLSYADLGPGFKPNISLNSPYIAEGENAVKAIPAVTQSKVWREYPYFWKGGATFGTEVLRYDDLMRVVVNVGGAASEKYRYRVSRLVPVPVTYEPGAYIGTVNADNSTAYPRDGYKDGYWYKRFAAKAEDVSFYYPGLSAKNVRDAIIEVVKTGGTGGGAAMSVIELEELPATGISGVMYVVKKPGDSDAIEYLWLDRWEKIGGAGSGQNAVQSSWAQNDPTQPDYVRNRTHWQEQGSVSLFAADLEMAPKETINEGTIVNVESDPITLEFEADKNYIVVWDGVPYECYCQKNDFYTANTNGYDWYLGNLDFVGNYHFAEELTNYGEGMPFLIRRTREYNGFKWTNYNTVFASGIEPRTIIMEICGEGMVYRPLDEGYIPESIARRDDITELDDTLTQSGKAADAKAVGDALAKVGRPTDEQVGNAVGDWLEAHPEATTVVADRSITVAKTTFIEPVTQNLIDISKMVKGNQSETGIPPGGTPGGPGYTTDYIPVEVGKTYRCNAGFGTGGWMSSWYYDPDKNPLSVIPENPFTVPEGVAYARLTWYYNDDPAVKKYALFEGRNLWPYTQGVQRYELDDMLTKAVERVVDAYAAVKAVPKNLYKLAGYGNVNGSTGVIDCGDAGSLRVSDYIEITPGVFYISNCLSAPGFTACYDSGKNYVAAFADASERFDTAGYYGFRITDPNVRYIVNGCEKTISKPISEPFFCRGSAVPKSFDGYDVAVPHSDVVDALKKLLGVTGNELAGLTWAVLGDSITAAPGLTRNYHGIIAQKLGLTAINYGYNGSWISHTDGIPEGNEMCVRYATMTDDADIITCFGGINDINNRAALGQMGDTESTTFYGAMDILIRGLLYKYPGKRIGFITPLRYGTGESEQPYIEAIHEVCEKYAVPVLDLYREGLASSATTELGDMFFKAGEVSKLHPNELGHDVIARKVEAFLRRL